MRRFFPLLLFFFVLAPAANATPPTVVAQASPGTGQAPLDVTLTATGNAVSYHWALGDGATADGAVVQHRYEAGRYTATVTATGADGSMAEASVTITALKLRLRGPKVGTYGRRATFRGRLVPALPNTAISLFAGESQVAGAKTNKAGRFRIRLRVTAPASYSARFGSIVSN